MRRDAHRRPPVEPFPAEVLPAPLRRVIEEGAHALPCPPDFIGVPMLTVLGVAIGTSREVEVKPGWREGPRLSSAIVAEPGSKKSPALDLALRPLYRAQDRLQAELLAKKTLHALALARYEIEAANWKKVIGKGTAHVSAPHPPPRNRSWNRSGRATPRSKRWRSSWSGAPAACASRATSSPAGRGR